MSASTAGNVKSLARRPGQADGTGTKVNLLGYRGKLVWVQTAQGLEVSLPEKKLAEDASTLKINGEDLEPVPVEPVVSVK